jgi:hypothetical protein
MARVQESPVTTPSSSSNASSVLGVVNDKNPKELHGIVNLEQYKLCKEDHEEAFASLVQESRKELCENSVVTLPNFLTQSAIDSLVKETQNVQHKAYYRDEHSTHNVYLTQTMDESKPLTHIYNRQVITSKGCVTNDYLPASSLLETLYHNQSFKQFVEHVLQVKNIYPYSPRDRLSSITVHYSSNGQELGWHFDNSAFAITLLLQKPQHGGVFEYVPHIRNKDAAIDTSSSTTNDEEVTMGFQTVEGVVDGRIRPRQLELNAGTLVLFHGRNSLHRVTKVVGETTRILVVLAYNEKEDMELPDDAKLIFFGRTGKEDVEDER